MNDTETTKARLEVATKGLEFARSKAHDWQSKLLLLQAFGTVLVGLAKTADHGGADRTQLYELVPAIVIVIFAVASLILYLANGHLRVARYWASEIDRLTGAAEFGGYRETLQEYYQGRSLWLGVAPAIVISLVLLGAALMVTVGYGRDMEPFRPRNAMLSIGLLGIAFISFVGNVVQSAYAEAPAEPRRS